MDKDNKVLLAAVLVILVALIAFNFGEYRDSWDCNKKYWDEVTLVHYLVDENLGSYSQGGNGMVIYSKDEKLIKIICDKDIGCIQGIVERDGNYLIWKEIIDYNMGLNSNFADLFGEYDILR